MTCFDRTEIQRITAISLDECGRIATSGNIALKGLAGAINIVNFTRNVDIPQQTIVKTVNGATCSKPRPTPTDRGIQVALTHCGLNPVFESLIGYKTLDMSGANVTGWEDSEITGNTLVALEIIYTPTADSCAGGGTPQCYASLYPSLEQWVRSGDEAYNGTDAPDMVTTGQTAKNARLFDNFTSGTLPTWLAHWAPKFDDIATGRSWGYHRLIDCPADDTGNPCTLTTL